MDSMERKFEKLEKMKYSEESIKMNNRLFDFYEDCYQEDGREDLCSLYEYIYVNDFE